MCPTSSVREIIKCFVYARRRRTKNKPHDRRSRANIKDGTDAPRYSRRSVLKYVYGIRAFELFSRPKSFPIVRAPFRPARTHKSASSPRTKMIHHVRTITTGRNNVLQRSPYLCRRRVVHFLLTVSFRTKRTPSRVRFDFFFSRTPLLRLERSYSTGHLAMAL